MYFKLLTIANLKKHVYPISEKLCNKNGRHSETCDNEKCCNKLTVEAFFVEVFPQDFLSLDILRNIVEIYSYV